MTDPIDAFLDAPAKAGDSIDSFLDTPSAPVRIKPTGGLTEKQLLHAGEGDAVPRTITEAGHAIINRVTGDRAIENTADLLGGMTITLRGTGNLIGQAFAGSKWGDRIWPTESLNKDSGGYMLGQVADPAAMLAGGVIGKGVQALPFVSKATQAVDAARLAERAAPRAAQITTQAIAPAVTGAATGGAVGYAASDGDAEEAAKAAGYGGLLSGLIPSGAKLISKTLGGAADWLTGRSGQVAAGDIARKAPGDQLPQVRAAMASAPSNITAGQAAVDLNLPSWSALDAFAKSKGGQSKYYYNLANEQAAARQGMLTGVTPDLVTAEKARNASKAMYPQAFEAERQLETSLNPPKPVTVITNPAAGTGYQAAGATNKIPMKISLSSIANEPIMKDAAKDAAGVIRNDSNLTTSMRDSLTGNPMDSLQGLHAMKIAIDNQLQSPNATSALSAYTDANLKVMRRKLITALSDRSPGYDAARTTFADLSKPVNQSKVLTNLSETLDNPVGNERVLPFTNALGRGEGSALKKSGLDARFGDTSDVLTPTQFSAVKNVEGQLIRDKTLAAQAQAGAGDLADIDSRLRLPNMMNQKAALVNKVLEYADKYLNQNTYKAIAEGMRNGKTATEMLNALPTSERNKALLIFTQAGQDLGNMGTAGAVIGTSRSK